MTNSDFEIFIAGTKMTLFAGILAILFVLFASTFITSCAQANISPKNIEIAKVIAAEACGEGLIGMQAVANVIQNRANEWGQSPYKVVTKKNQFYGYTSPNKNRLYSQCKKEADSLSLRLNELQDITNGALYFRQPSEPLYSWHGAETVKIGNHIFHKEAK